MTQTFTTTLILADGKNATGISVPPEIIAALGKSKRPPVKVTVNGYTYRSTVAAYGDRFMLPLSQERRAEAGLHPGDQIIVTLELDTEPRTVELPADLHTALSQKAGLLERFQGLSYTNRKEYVRQVEDAKTQETRTRRIANIVAKLSESADG